MALVSYVSSSKIGPADGVSIPPGESTQVREQGFDTSEGQKNTTE